jgi:regulator of protease activity HflC (stomatin/prohibitin superfamily)
MVENKIVEEKVLKAKNGMAILIANIILYLGSFAGFIISMSILSNEVSGNPVLATVLLVISIIYFFVGPIIFIGLKVLKPNEALVLTLFGKYYGTLKGEGFYFVNPFASALNPATSNTTTGNMVEATPKVTTQGQPQITVRNKKISLKVMTLNNDKQKINDQLGNPITIGIVVIWRVINTAKAVFNVDNYTEYLSIQCDAALRNIIRLYPYDISDSKTEDNEKSLRGSSQEVADKLKAEIQKKVEIAGLEVIEARITHLAYAPEIAAVMLQRQQATAIVDARQTIVDGAVGMVEMALAKLKENNIVDLDNDSKAKLVSNLLVVLCSNKDTQPIVNTTHE